jgi:hypothetical protein
MPLLLLRIPSLLLLMPPQFRLLPRMRTLTSLLLELLRLEVKTLPLLVVLLFSLPSLRARLLARYLGPYTTRPAPPSLLAMP